MHLHRKILFCLFSVIFICLTLFILIKHDTVAANAKCHYAAAIQTSPVGPMTNTESDNSGIRTSNYGKQLMMLPRNIYHSLWLALVFLLILSAVLLLTIYKLKTTEAKLATSEEHYRSIFNHSSTGLIVCESWHKIISVNPTACKLFGCSAETLKVRGLDGLGDKDFLSTLIKWQNENVSKSMIRETVLTRYDGTTFPADISVYPVTTSKKLLVIAIRDITVQKQAEATSALYKKRFYEAFHASPSIMSFKKADDFTYVEVNKAFLDYTGYSADQLIGADAVEVGILESQNKLPSVVTKLRKGERVENVELMYKTKDNALRTIISSFKLIELGDTEFLLTISTDITERQQMRAEMARMDSLSVVGQMAAGIGHEIRNPMTTVRGFLQFMQANHKYKDNKRHFDLMISELDRANAIITEFLSLAKTKQSNMEQHQLNDVINALLPLMQTDAIKCDQEIFVELQEDLPPMIIDENEIRQLILNLVRNGLEAMTERHKAITISTYATDASVALVVKDQGPGIPIEIIPKIGTPFFTTKEDGTGLGLAVCYSIAERHHARIDIDTSSAGTTFTTLFPRHQSDIL